MERVPGELEEEFRGGCGEVNVLYHSDCLQALIETYDRGPEVSTIRCCDALQVIDLHTSDGITWEDSLSIAPSQ